MENYTAEKLFEMIEFMRDTFIYEKGKKPTEIKINFRYFEILLQNYNHLVRCENEEQHNGNDLTLKSKMTLCGMKIERTKDIVIQVF